MQVDKSNYENIQDAQEFISIVRYHWVPWNSLYKTLV